MKKIIYVLLGFSFLTVTIFAVGARQKANRRLVVTPYGKGIPHHAPLDSYYYGLKAFAEEKGYVGEWLNLKTIPKQSQLLKRFVHFFLSKHQAKAYLFRNYHSFYSKAKIAQLPKGKRILIMGEPPSVLFDMYQENVQALFDKVCTWNTDLVDGKKYFKICYPVLRPMQEELPSFSERKLLCMVASNFKFNDYEKEIYSTRREVVRFFETQPEGLFDLFGRGWDGVRHAKGAIPDKLEKLQEYKFNICFENATDPGYITEKIFDCFVTGTIPIYYGASNVEDFIPKGCYIDYRDFKDMEDVLRFIQTLSETEYDTYVANMRTYLDSEQAQQFSPTAFGEVLVDVIQR